MDDRDGWREWVREIRASMKMIFFSVIVNDRIRIQIKFSLT